MERVSIIEGKKPVLLVCPHVPEEIHTDAIAVEIAKAVNGYAVINRGWERSEHVDLFNDKANCNNITHCLEDVIKDEFFDPILKFTHRLLKKHGFCYMINIHGMGNDIRKQIQDNVDIVLGYGDGEPPSHTCEPWRKDAFTHLLNDCGMLTYQAKAKGKYSARSKNNLTQLFRQWPQWKTMSVQSFQLEIVLDMRKEIDIAELTADMISMSINDLLDFDENPYTSEEEQTMGVLKC
jgi:hypothetical protein